MDKELEKQLERIGKAINDSGLTYAELAEITGISKSTIHRYAKGLTEKIGIGNVEKIANATNISVSYLMGWDEQERVAQILTKVTFDKDLQFLIEQTKDLSNQSKKRLLKYIELLKEEEKENE